MSDEKKDRPADPKSILATLENLSHAIDTMTHVVGELRDYLDENWDIIEVSSIVLEPEDLEVTESALGRRTVH